MKIAVFLLMAVSAWGQTAEPVGVMQNKTPVPSQCGKYQHWEESHVSCDITGNIGTCNRWVAAHCVDDMHLVTEREWQELMERLSKLEKAGKQ